VRKAAQNSAVSLFQINEKTASGKKRLRLGAFWLLFGRQKVTKVNG
jgi:hypothetical protein